MMDQLTDDYVSLFRAEEQDGRLLSTTGSERVAQGSYCFTDKLPSNQDHYHTTDIWGYMDCQESAGLSPAMYGEFLFSLLQKVLDCYGRVSYGCCEAVHAIWDDSSAPFPIWARFPFPPGAMRHLWGKGCGERRSPTCASRTPP